MDRDSKKRDRETKQYKKGARKEREIETRAYRVRHYQSFFGFGILKEAERQKDRTRQNVRQTDKKTERQIHQVETQRDKAITREQREQKDRETGKQRETSI